MKAQKLVSPNSAALVAAGLVLPFVVLNAIVSGRIEPFFSLIRPGFHTSPLEYVLLFGVVLLLPVGAFIALRPVVQLGADGRRRLYVLNGIVAVLLLTLFVALAVGLGSDIYTCDVLHVPNCD
jgi:hypothetical protein